jgi:hypothetical protein
MVCARAVRDRYALAYDFRAIYAAHVAAMVIGHVGNFEVRVALVDAKGTRPSCLQ